MERVRLIEPPLPPESLVARGRLTRKLIRQISALLLEGLPLDGVVDFLGMSHSTFALWDRHGKAYLSDPEANPEYAIYGEYVVACRRALASYRLNTIRVLHRTKTRLWIRQMAILERRDRKNFGRRDPLGGADDEADPDERFL